MRRTRARFPVLILFLLVFLSGCQLQDSYSGKIILSGVHNLGPAETVAGELVVLGGKVALQPGSKVSGSVHVFDGSVYMDGDIAGNVLVLAGSVELGPQAVVHGDLNSAGGLVSVHTGAKVLGRTTQPSAQPQKPPAAQAGRLLTLSLELVLLPGLAFLCARFLPGPLANVSQAAVSYGLPSAALGLLAWVVGLSLLVLMAYTILLIPLALLGFFAMLAATTYGAVPYALWMGRWLSLRLHWKIAPAAQAGLGMVLLIGLMEVTRFLPVLGAVLPLLLFAASFGAVLLTRFGLQRYTPPILEEPSEALLEQ